MARLRVARITGAGSANLPRLRVAGISASGAGAASRLRVGGITADGAASTTTARLRVAGISAAGTGAAVALNPIAGFDAGPLEVVTVTATTQGGAAVDSWTWRRISGPTVTLTPTAGVLTFTCPSIFPGATQALVLGVTATVGASTSAEVTFTVNVLPQMEWAWKASTSSWVGAAYAPA